MRTKKNSDLHNFLDNQTIENENKNKHVEFVSLRKIFSLTYDKPSCKTVRKHITITKAILTRNDTKKLLVCNTSRKKENCFSQTKSSNISRKKLSINPKLQKMLDKRNFFISVNNSLKKIKRRNTTQFNSLNWSRTEIPKENNLQGKSKLVKRISYIEENKMKTMSKYDEMKRINKRKILQKKGKKIEPILAKNIHLKGKEVKNCSIKKQKKFIKSNNKDATMSKYMLLSS
jgi:hypothetical protein